MIAAHRILEATMGRQVEPGLCALAVMTKVPRAGKVKTRLTPPLTPSEAAALNTCFLRDTTEAISSMTKKGGAACIAVYTPAGEEEEYRGILPDEFQLLAQRGDSFGDRLILATKDLLALGFDSVCLIDSDSPTVPPQFYEQAVQRLAQAGDRIVLGPSDDGGYYLIGLKKPHCDIFQQIDWSTKHVLQQTIERAAGIGVEVETLPTWYDVDDGFTLRRLCQEFFGPDSQAMRGYEAPHTRSYLAELLRLEGRNRIWPNES
jgi:rSAM/selenodomain-associated transferase 1